MNSFSGALIKSFSVNAFLVSLLLAVRFCLSPYRNFYLHKKGRNYLFADITKVSLFCIRYAGYDIHIHETLTLTFYFPRQRNACRPVQLLDMATNGYLSPDGKRSDSKAKRKRSSEGENVSLDVLKPRTSGSRLPSLATLVSKLSL